jgi:hypothetical protein
MSKPNEAPAPETKEERRQFLQRLGKYAAVTPPAITMMLSATTVPAHARGSGGGGGAGAGLGDDSGPAPGPAPSPPSHRLFNLGPAQQDRGRTEAADRS